MAEAPQHISLKVKLDDDIRRFSVPKTITFAELHVLIAKHFVLAPENVQIKYVDDEEELITLGSDLELQEATRLQPTVLRLNVYDVKPKHVASYAQGKLEAVFVRDVTVPDNTSVTAGVKFSKVWCVKNSGSEPWPKGVVLKMVDPKDSQLLVLAVGAINRLVAPGEETDIGVELQAPSRPGRCVQYWRLFTEDGQAFGRRLWLDINVSPSLQGTAEDDTELERAEEEARRAAQAEEERRLREEEEALRRAAEEAELQRAASEEERRREEQRFLREEEELLRQEEEKMRRAAEEEVQRVEEARRAAQAEEERRLRKEEEALRRAAEEAELQRAAAAERQLRAQEEETRQAAKKKAEEELKRKEEEERRRFQSKYPAQLTALAEMGFTNIEHNEKLLDKHKGSLDLALEALLSGN
jgi:hypothetical protein